MVRKAKFLPGLALVVACVSLIDFAPAQSSPPAPRPLHFPTQTQITNADPSIRLEVLVHVPTRLKIERTTNTLSVSVDNKNFLESTNLSVGTNMVTGVQFRLSVYPASEKPPPDDQSFGLASGFDFNTGTQFFNAKRDHLPLPGVKYTVEVILTAFETDIPPGHFWSPYGKNYKVLWRRTLKQIVE
jgi:hypothetical protein